MAAAGESVGRGTVGLAADWIISGGHVETMEPGGRTADAVAIRSGRVLAVGSVAEVASLRGPETRFTDLDGRTLLPAFVDTHMHLEKIAGELAMTHLEGVGSLGELLSQLAATACRLPPGEWLQSFGDDNAWHERRLAEGRLPTRDELDSSIDDRPVFLYRGPDAAVLNSVAVAELGSLIDTVAGATLDPTSGLLSGPDIRSLLGDLRLLSSVPGPAILGEACKELLSFGIATVVDPGLPGRFMESWYVYRDAIERGTLPVRVELMNRLDYRLSFEEEFARVQEEPIGPLAGDDHLRAFGIKLILDGEFWNAWVRSDDADSVAPAQRYSAAEIDAVFDLCGSRGWPCCIHVMGGGAIDFVIERLERAIAQGCRFSPNQVSLAHAFLPSRENLVACVRLGVAVSVQPLLSFVFEHEMSAAWGELAQRSNPYATMRACGLSPAGGSDVLPCEPLRGAQVAVTRRSREGTIFGPAEALTPREAVELFTSSTGPYMRHFDRGRISPGCHADLAIWPENPLSVDPETWPSLRTHLVAVGGEVAYEA